MKTTSCSKKAVTVMRTHFEVYISLSMVPSKKIGMIMIAARGDTAIYRLYRYVPLEGYGFQAVYLGIGYINQTESGSRRGYHFVCLFVCFFIFPSVYLFYKPFILYYKIEELKMLFVELNIRLQE